MFREADLPIFGTADKHRPKQPMFVFISDFKPVGFLAKEIINPTGSKEFNKSKIKI